MKQPYEENPVGSDRADEVDEVEDDVSVERVVAEELLVWLAEVEETTELLELIVWLEEVDETMLELLDWVAEIEVEEATLELLVWLAELEEIMLELLV